MKTSHAHCSLTQHALTPPLAPLATHFGPEVRAAAAFPVPPKKNRTRNRLGASFGQNKFRINPLSDSEEISKTTDLLDFLFVPFFLLRTSKRRKGHECFSLTFSLEAGLREGRERERERERKKENQRKRIGTEIEKSSQREANKHKLFLYYNFVSEIVCPYEEFFAVKECLRSKGRL